MKASLHRFIFDRAYLSTTGIYPDRWLKVAAVCTAMYAIFALVLIGVPGLSRGGVVSALLCVAWLAYGVGFKHKWFPVVLWIPVAFFVTLFALGFQVDYYPVAAVGKLVTTYFGPIAITMFVANGLSIRFVIACFALVVFCNIVAYALGYDGASLQLKAADHIMQYAEVKRSTALAGQANLLVALVYTFPFSLFLLRRHIAVNILVACLVICAMFMFLTASRSTLPYTFMFLIFACTFLIRSSSLRVSIFFIGALVLMLISFLVIAYPIQTIMENSSLADIEIIYRILEVLNKESGSIDSRISVGTDIGYHFYRSPFFGYGPNQFSVEVGRGSYAHNNTAELLINYGIMGTLIFYSMYVMVLANIISNPQTNRFLIAPLLYLMASDFVFVTHVERPLVLLLCLLLFVSSTSYRRS